MGALLLVGLASFRGEEAAADEVGAGEMIATGCALVVGDLPSSSLYDHDDRRLLGKVLVVVHKSRRRLMVFERGALKQCLPVGLGFSPMGHKEVEGDGKTPEGWYRTSDKPWSTFRDAIAIHYPNVFDAERGYRRKRISKRTRDEIVRAHRKWRIPPQRTAMGGAILIHGGGSANDWTLGCIALENSHLERLRLALPKNMRFHLLILA